MTKPLTEKAKDLLRNQQALALYALPGNKELQLIGGTYSTFEVLPSQLEQLNGFLFAPYRPHPNHPVYLIQNGNDEVNCTAIAGTPQHTTNTQNTFTRQVSQTIEYIKTQPQLSKVVLSRPIDITLETQFEAVDFFLKLQALMPTALCYLVHIPEQGLWIGASPEKLLKINGKHAQTNSIAGTLPSNSPDDWSDKERDEQQIVSDYISHQLESIGIANYRTQGPDTIVSGSVQHLKTTFYFELDQPQQAYELISSLHPTPAICGMPQLQAEHIISQLESYSREYYAGFLGPIGMYNESHIFVNLRCMKVIDNNARLFVGAGITAGSDPEKEWIETEVKAQTLLKVIENK